MVEISFNLFISESQNSKPDSESNTSTSIENSKNSIYRDVILSNSIYVPLPDKTVTNSAHESDGEIEEVVPRRSRSLSTLRSKSPPPPRFRCTNTTKLTSTVPETHSKLGFKAELPANLTTVAPVPKHTIFVCSLLSTNKETENELDSLVVQPHPRRKLVGKPMFAHVYLNNVPVVALIDPGSAVNVISHSLYNANKQWPTAKIDVDLSFANGAESNVNVGSFNNVVSANGFTAAKTDFIVSPFDTPLVDIILGEIFLTQNNALMSFGALKAVKFLPSGSVWYDTNIQEHQYDESVSVCSMQEAAKIFKIGARSKQQAIETALLFIDAPQTTNLASTTSTTDITTSSADPNSTDQLKYPKSFQQLLEKSKDAFSTTVPEPTQRKPSAIIGEGMKIPLKDGALPVNVRGFNPSAGEMKVIQYMCSELMDKGYIEHASKHSKWGAPIMLVKKPGDRVGVSNMFRLVTDFRRVNKLTDKTSSAYSPPVINDLFRMLAGASVFSLMDLVSGFYQMPLHPDSRDMSTFVCQTPTGPVKYRFKVVVMGLTGAPSYFQTQMEKVMEGIAGVIVYLDDIMVFSNSIEEHIKILEQVFDRMKENGLYFHPDKCKFLRTTIQFLGMKISKNNIMPSDEKYEALRNFEEPTTVPEVRRFLGFSQYLAMFIPNFNCMTAPLSDLLKKDKTIRKFVFTLPCKEAFNKIINALNDTAGLRIPSLNAYFVLECDASSLGVGACLYELLDGILYPVYFISKKFSGAERNYAPRDQEALAVVYSLIKFRSYLYLSFFTLYSDHQSLQHFQDQRDLHKRDWRWQELMSEFNYEHRYRKGETMVVPDALSRSFGENPEPAEVGVLDEINLLRPPSGACGVEVSVPTPTPPSQTTSRLDARKQLILLPLNDTEYSSDLQPQQQSPDISTTPTTDGHSQQQKSGTPSASETNSAVKINIPQNIAPGLAAFDFEINAASNPKLSSLLEDLVEDHYFDPDGNDFLFSDFEREDGGGGEEVLVSSIDVPPVSPFRARNSPVSLSCESNFVSDCNLKASLLPSNKEPPHCKESLLLQAGEPNPTVPICSKETPSLQGCFPAVTQASGPVPTVKSSESEPPLCLGRVPANTGCVPEYIPHTHAPSSIYVPPAPLSNERTRTSDCKNFPLSPQRKETPPCKEPPLLQQSASTPAVHAGKEPLLLRGVPASGSVPPVHKTEQESPLCLGCVPTVNNVIPRDRSSSPPHSLLLGHDCQHLPQSGGGNTQPQQPDAVYRQPTVKRQQHRNRLQQRAPFCYSVIATVNNNWLAELPPLYNTDLFFAPIYKYCKLPADKLTLKQRATIKYYSIVDDCLYYSNCDDNKLRLCVPSSVNNYIRRLILFENHDALLHQSRDKSYNRVAANYYWPRQAKDVKRYIYACRQCRLLKSRQHTNQGLLSSLPIPSQRFSHIHIDYITGLQLSPCGHDQILVAVCALSKFLYLIPAKNSHRSIDASRLLFNHVISIHGPPTAIISDMDPKFISAVYTSIMQFFNVERQMSTSHNHNRNGACEIVIKTIEVLLRHVLSHYPDRSFVDFLPLVAYIYNSAVHSSTKVSPYFALFGFEPANPSLLLCDAAPAPTDDQLPAKPDDKLAVQEFIQHQQAVSRQIKDALQLSQRTMEIFQNSTRKDVQYGPGQWVFLNTTNLDSHYFARSEQKLQDRYVGPFQIIEQTSAYNYRLRLPPAMSKLPNVFHAALLWLQPPAQPDLQPIRQPDHSALATTGSNVPVPPPTGVLPPPLTRTQELAALDHDEFEVESILARKKVGKGYRYFVKWVGYPDADNSWLARKDLATTGLAAAVKAFDASCTDPVPD